jgi:hypothetical protein
LLKGKIRKLIADLTEERFLTKMVINSAYGVINIPISDEVDIEIANTSWKNFGKLETLDNVIKSLGKLVGKNVTFSKLWD